MDCANGAGAVAGEDRSKVSDFREQILQLAGLACHEDEEKSRTELLEKLYKCNKYTLVELCHSFDIPGSTGTKKDELVTIVMEFLMEHYSGVDGTDPDKKVKKRKRKREGENLSGGKPSKNWNWNCMSIPCELMDVQIEFISIQRCEGLNWMELRKRNLTEVYWKVMVKRKPMGESVRTIEQTIASLI